MKIAFWIWTGICIIGAVLLPWLVPTSLSNKSYSGNDILLTTDDRHQLTINAQPATVEMASGDFFVLLSYGGETIFGVPTQKPLGWDGGAYYKTQPTKVQSGVWTVEKGSDISVHLSGSGNMTVQNTLKDSELAEMRFWLVVLALLIWVLGVVLIN